MGNYFIPQLNNEFYKYRNVVEQMIAEDQPTFLIDSYKKEVVNPQTKKIEYVNALKVLTPETGGIDVYYTDARLPNHGFPYPEAVFAINLAKSCLVEPLKLVKYFWFAFIPLLFQKNALEQLVISYNRCAYRQVSPHILQDRFLTAPALELKKFIFMFLVEMGVSEVHCMNLAETLSAIIEYDNAYRWRLQDVMGETTREKLLADPASELERLIKIYVDREPGKVIKDKIVMLCNAVRLALMIPKIKKAFIEAIKETNIENFYMDESDKYWSLQFTTYNFGGRPKEERLAEWEAQQHPQAYKINLN